MKKALLCITAFTVFLFGCEKIDESIDEAVDTYILDGFYQSSGELVVEVDGNSATVYSFGNLHHPLGTNSSVFKLGDPYIKNIRKTGEDEWEGDVVHMKTTNSIGFDTLISISYEKTKISKLTTQPGFLVDNYDAYIESIFKKIDPPPGAGSGNGNGSGNGSGSGTDTVHKQKYTGDLHEKVTISYTPPTGTKSMTIRATEFGTYDRNYADMFVRKSSAPVINHTYPPNGSSYTWTADHAGVNPNRDDEVYTVSNPSGTYYITLYGYNMDFTSWLVITTSK